MKRPLFNLGSPVSGTARSAFEKVSEQGRGRLVPVERHAMTKRGDEAVPAPNAGFAQRP